MIEEGKRGPRNELDDLAGLVPPTMLLLAAMLQDQIGTLARLHAKGLWKESPGELEGLSGVMPELSGLTRHDMVMEGMIWNSTRTDALIEAVERCTPIRIDRGRIVNLAKKRGKAQSHRRNLTRYIKPGRRR